MYEEKLKELGLESSTDGSPVANYVPCVVENGWLYISWPTSHGERPTRSGQANLATALMLSRVTRRRRFAHSTALAQSNRFSALLTVWSAL